MAVGRRQPAAGLRHHSDRGSHYACQAYQRLLDDAGMRYSLRRKGDCLDNAVAERFFGSLTRERTAHGAYATRQDARDDGIDDIERFYHSTRQHSSLRYLRPNEYAGVRKVAELSVRFPLTTTITQQGMQGPQLVKLPKDQAHHMLDLFIWIIDHFVSGVVAISNRQRKAQRPGAPSARCPDTCVD